MSMSEIPPNGLSKVYDEYGRISIPGEIRDEMGISKGDKVRLFYKDGEIIVRKIEQ